MEKLEQFIRNNSELFNDEEPRTGHLGRFEALLDKEHGRVIPVGRRYAWMRVAAVAVVLVTAGLIGFDLLSGRAFTGSGNGLASVVYTEDTREALDYYSKMTAERMTEIDKIAQSCPEGQHLRSKALRDAAEFDANHDELTVALKENPGNEKMEAAVIRNQKLKEEALNNIILQGNMEDCNKK
jgi:hypothetical protein